MSFQSHGQRDDDMQITFPFGVEIKASGRTVVLVLLVLVIVASILWHDYKSSSSFEKIEKAIWYQTAVLVKPESERKHFVATSPPEVKQKLAAQNTATCTIPCPPEAQP